MDDYRHELYFEAKDLTDREKDKIRRYFQKKRDSGGGDCGMIENVGGDVHKICFADRDDQERVLQRKFHTLSLPRGELRLTVSRTNSQLTPDRPTHTQVFTKANTKALEKIFRIDIYLIYYLRDNPKALKLLQKQLSSVGCTVEFNLDEEEAIVRGDIEKGPGGAFGAAETWELQVDRVFIELTETYICHHVMDSKQTKILLQDRSSLSDDIKVYSEIGYSVVVGEAQAVKRRIAALEKSTPTRKEVPVVEKKFKLIEEEFKGEMRVRYPKVKVLTGNAMIILEGPNEEVQSAVTKLDQLMKTVIEKRVKLPADLLTFMKSSGAISKYQTRFQQSLRNPVLLEVGSDLILSSLSSGALDEAEAAVKRDLSLETVQLQGTVAVPPELNRLKEILLKAKSEANSQELKVDVSFIPGNIVQLVGYSGNVNHLKEVLFDYQMNQVETQETLNLQYPEMVDCFDELMKLLCLKQTKVTLKALHFPYPCVLVSGPRCHVKEVEMDLISTLSAMTSDTLVLDGIGAQQYFRAAGKVSKDLIESSCQVIIREQQSLHSQNVQTKPRSVSCPNLSATPTSLITRMHSLTVGSYVNVNNQTSLEVKLGSLEDQQVNVLVVPMVKKQLGSTNIGKGLLRKSGNQIQAKFDSAATNCIFNPGDVLEVAGPASLGCSKLFFIECSPWDGARGQSVQALNKGLKKCLDLCIQQGLSSVAFPIIGPGIVLKYPLREAIEILTENIRQFGLSASSGSLSTIHIVVKPGYPDSEESYHDVYRNLSSDMNQGGQVIFRSLTSDLDDVMMTVGGGVKLHVVFGDITNETTDVVVNTTDFVHFQDDGVCKDILTVAGPGVTAQLNGVKVNRGEVFQTNSGSFPCKAIFHVCGEKDAGIIEKLVCRIIELSESSRYKSVAIPAICAGAGGLDPGVVAAAIIRAVKTATASNRLHSVTDIRLVLIKINVFLAFRGEAMQMFSTAVMNRVPGPQLLQRQPTQPVQADLSSLYTSSTDHKSIFLILGLDRNDVNDAKMKLKTLYDDQCSTETLTNEQLESLTEDDVEELKRLVEMKGLFMPRDPSGQGKLMVSGLRDGVNQVMQLINACVHGSLRREVRVREEENLYARVSWCILAPNGNWERLPMASNYNLEKKDIAAGIVDAHGIHWNVDLQRMEATPQGHRQMTKTQIKRLENLHDFTFPLYWDNMTAREGMKRVVLQQSSAEYRAIKEAFKRSCTKSVVNIERLQNIHLRRAYEAQKTKISEKNAHVGGAGEKLLYHGTTQNNCDSIMETGFNRRFAGQNATAYGIGTYFAVNASYSANATYSKPAADGSQLMFVARVLTGLYTQGDSTMKVPPERDPQRSHDRYDSVVDAPANPSMFVVFHDNQAYPDYLITFK